MYVLQTKNIFLLNNVHSQYTVLMLTISLFWPPHYFWCDVVFMIRFFSTYELDGSPLGDGIQMSIISTVP